MKRINFLKTIVFLLLLLSANISFSQARDVFWLEGNGQLDDIWTNYNQYFDNTFGSNRINNHRQDYWSGGGVNIAAADAANGVLSNNGSVNNFTNAIAVGHSLGGVVLQQIEAQPAAFGQRFGGVITIGSPLVGAQVSNSVQSGLVASVATDGVRILTTPYIRLGTVSAFPTFSGFSQGRFFTTPGASLISNVTTSFFIERAMNLTTPLIQNQLTNNFVGQTEQDLAVGSPYFTNTTFGIHNLPVPANPIPKIHIWGDEVSPIHYRIWTSLAMEIEDDKAPYSLGLNGISTSNTVASIYQLSASLQMMSAFASLFSLVAAPNPASALSLAGNLWVASGFQSGVKYINHDSEHFYRVLIGESMTVNTSICTNQWICTGNMLTNCMNANNNNYNFCTGTFCVQQSCYTTSQLVLQQSDAYIQANSQQGRDVFGNVMPLSAGAISIRVDRLNHSEQWYHEDLRDVLEDILDGSHPTAPLFFQL